jgi:flavin-binding protein dodecin
MAKDRETGVYRIVDVVGVSTVSWEDAGKRAVETAAKSIRDLRIAEVTEQLIALLVLTDFERRAVVWRKLIRCRDAVKFDKTGKFIKTWGKKGSTRAS